MTLDLGDLVGYLVVDDKRWNFDGALRSMDQFGDKAKLRAKQAGDQAGGAFGDTLVPEAERAGEEAGEKAGEGFITKGRLGAAAAGTAFGVAFVEALDLGASQDKLVAQLGANAHQSERYGRVAGKLYADAWGDSMDDVNTAVASVVTTIDGMDTAGGRQLRLLTSRALDFASAFEVDVARGTQIAGQLISTKLAPNGIRALDLLTRGAQKVPLALREDLLDAVDEYGQFFHSLGYDGKQAFALLVDASSKGMYGLDKAGDAIKEFTIRATDGSKATNAAFEMIGLDSEAMSNKILKGGDDAQEATQKIIQGLLDIEDPSARARTALALFGTPLEDLNVKDIPDFLRNLQGASDTMDGFRGSSKRMSDDLNGNARTSITEFKRTMQMELVGYLEDKVIPVLEDDVIPAVRRFGDWFEKDGGPALRDFKDDLDPVIDAVGDLAGFLNDMPGEAKLVALGGLLAGGAAMKMRGGGGGVLGTAGSVLGVAKPIPVFVTNPGFGLGADVPGGGKPGKASKGRNIARLLPWLAVGDAAYEATFGDLYGLDPDRGPKAPTSPGQSAFGIGALGTDDTASQGSIRERDAAHSEQRTQRLRDFYLAGDLATESAKKLGMVTDANVGKFDAFYRSTGHAQTAVDEMRDSLDLLGNTRATPAILLSGIERAMGQIATLNAGLDALGERGLDNGVTFMHGGVGGGREGGGGSRGIDGRAGITNHFHGDIRPYDSREFYRDVQSKSQFAGLGGVG